MYNRDKAWQRARETDLLTDWQHFRQFRNKCSASIKKAKSNYYITSLTNSDSYLSKFWKIVKSLKHTPAASLPQHIHSDDGPVFDKQEMGSVFNHHFIAAGNIFENSKHTAALKEQADHNSGSTIRPSEIAIFSFREFTEKEVLNTLLIIYEKKSMGEDQLSYDLLPL